MRYSLGWSKDPGPSADGEVPHHWRVNTRHFYTKKTSKKGFDEGIKYFYR